VRRSLFILVWLLAGTLALSVGLVVWCVWFLDLNDHKDSLRDLMVQTLGLDVEIAGRIEHRWSGGLFLSARDLTARRDGETVAVVDEVRIGLSLGALLKGQLIFPRLEAKVSSIDVIWDANGVLNLAPRLTDPSLSPRREKTALGWISDIRIDVLQAEIAQGRYRDLEEGYDLAVEETTVRLSPLPILDQGQVVVDTPALLMGYALAGDARAQSFEIGDIRFEGLELEAKNDRGTLAIEHLGLALVRDGRQTHSVCPRTVKGVGIDAQGTLQLYYDRPAEQLSQALWREFAGIDLEGAKANFDTLYLGNGPGRLVFEETRFETSALPLARDRSFLAEILRTSPERLLAEKPLHLAARGKAMSIAAGRLENFDLALASRDGRLAATLKRGWLNIERAPPEDPRVDLTTRLAGSGKIALKRTRADASGKRERLPTVTAEQLDLKAEKGTLTSSWGPITYDQIDLTADRLPLAVEEGPLDWKRLGDLVQAAGELRLSFAGRGIKHGAHEISSLAFSLAGGGDRLAIETLDAVVANARVTGEGVVTLVEDRYPWSLYLATDQAAIAPILELFTADIAASGTVAANAELSGTGLALDRIELGMLSLDLDEARVAASGGPLVLGSSHLECHDLPLLADGRTLLELLADGSKRLLAAAPFRLTASGSSVSVGPTRLNDFEWDLASRNGVLSVALAKGRLMVAARDAAAPVKALSTTLTGKAELDFKGHTGKRAVRSLPLASLTARKAHLDANGGKLETAQGDYSIDSLALNVDRLPLVAGGRPLDLTRPQDLYKVGGAARLYLQARRIEHREGTVESVTFVVLRQGDRLLLEDAVAEIGDSTLSAEGEVDLQGRVSPRRLRLAGDRVRLSPLMAWFGAPFQAKGNLALSVDVRGTGFDLRQLRKGLGGQVQMDAADVDVEGIDLDKVFTHLEYTQDGGLLDVAAYVLAGPAGPLLVTTSDFINLIDSAEARGRSRLLRIRSDLKIRNGKVHIEDAAMVTPHHRLALKGSLSTDPNGPLDLQIATLEPDGCPIYLENVCGTVAAPKISEASLLVKTLGRPVQSVLGIVEGILPLPCNEPFYTGAVKPLPIQAGERMPRNADGRESTRRRDPPTSRESRRKSPDVNLFLDQDL
jgi:hypothetical protein